MPAAQIPNLRSGHEFGPQKVPGAYIWGVEFELPAAAARDGFIVQEMHMTEDGTNSLGQRRNNVVHYWEAWPVGRGNRLITDPAGRQTIAQFVASQTGGPAPTQASLQVPMNDIFFRTFPLGNVGWKVVRATAAFFHEPLPADFVANNSTTGGGSLPSTLTKPGFWDAAQQGLARLLWFEFDFTTTRQPANATLRTAIQNPGRFEVGTNPGPSLLRTHQ